MSITQSRRNRILAMAGLMLVMFLVSMDMTVVSTAMPQIIADLNGFELYAWVTTAYLLVETSAIPIVGKLGDLYGRKWITVVGYALFLATSALCGTSQSMLALVIFRGFQGLGGGMVFTTVFTQVADIFPDMKERAKYQGYMFSVFTISSIIGPAIGGWITDYLSWRWVFYINIPLGLFALLTMPKVLPQNERQPGAKIDILGGVISTISVVSLLLAVEMTQYNHAWTSPEVIGGLVVGVLGFVLFGYVEYKSEEPIIPMWLLKIPAFRLMLVVMFLIGIFSFSVGMYIPLFVQGVKGGSASLSGTLMIPMVITQTVIGIVIGPYFAKVGQAKPFLVFGLILACGGLFLLTTLNGATSMWLIPLYLVVMALGMGMVMPVTTLAVQSLVEMKFLGVVTSSVQFVRSIGSTLGTALLGTLITSTYLLRLNNDAPLNLPSEAIQALHSPNALIDETSLASLSSLMADVPNSASQTTALLNAARIGLIEAIQAGFWFLFITAILSLAVSVILPKISLTSDPSMAFSPEGNGPAPQQPQVPEAAELE